MGNSSLTSVIVALPISHHYLSCVAFQSYGRHVVGGCSGRNRTGSSLTLCVLGAKAQQWVGVACSVSAPLDGCKQNVLQCRAVAMLPGDQGALAVALPELSGKGMQAEKLDVRWPPMC